MHRSRSERLLAFMSEIRDLPSSGLRLQYDAELEAARRALSEVNTANVDSWTDETGNLFHATQATAALQPVLMHDGVRWLVRFDGVDDELSSSHASQNTPLTVVAAARNRSDTLFSAILDSGDLGLWQGDSTPTQLFATDNFIFQFSGGDPHTNLFVATLVSDGSSSRLRGAGSDGKGTLNVAPLASFTMGGYRFPTDSFSELDLCSLLIYNRALSSHEIEGIESWLKDRYSI